MRLFVVWVLRYRTSGKGAHATVKLDGAISSLLRGMRRPCCAAMVGAMVMARGVDDPEFAQESLQATLASLPGWAR
jgi:hypothetical protein